MVGALLFLAMAYFAVGQAAATRDAAQTAADAAALAATQDTAAQLRAQLLQALAGGPADLVPRLLDGHSTALTGSCDRAAQLAADNRAHTTSCAPVPGGYAVSVRTDESVGRSVIPGTDRTHATAGATAVLTPLCRLPGPGGPTGPPQPIPTQPTPTQSTPAPPTPPGAVATASPSGGGPTTTLECRDGVWRVDPGRPETLPPLADLYLVHLTR